MPLRLPPTPPPGSLAPVLPSPCLRVSPSLCLPVSLSLRRSVSPSLCRPVPVPPAFGFPLCPPPPHPKTALRNPFPAVVVFSIRAALTHQAPLTNHRPH